MKLTIDLDESEIAEAVKETLRNKGFAVASVSIRAEEWEADRCGGKQTRCIATAKLEIPRGKVIEVPR